MHHKSIIFFLIGITSLSAISCNLKEQSLPIQDKNLKTTEIEVWSDFEKKESWFIRGSNFYNSIDSLPDDFITFYQKFISDETFQTTHIKFPILAAFSECDTTILLNKNNWEIFTWDFRKDFYNPLDSNIIYLAKNKFYFKNIRDEIGELFRMGFEKIEGEWYMTYYLANAC